MFSHNLQAPHAGAQGIREKVQAFDIIHSHAWSPTDSLDQVLNVCSIMKAAITLQPLRNRGQVRVRWIPVSTDEDDRKITGYYIYYKETKEKNIGHMDGRDACNDGWKREHVEAEHSTDKMEETLTGLKPDHRYAVYVETDTVADADIGARSNISYITTMPYSQFMFLPPCFSAH
ncbi:Insulin-like receptor [Portunus trituberculatus]|uniref:Insulin-like receptor n=1 Tax=Portunus trituberculatus TaxID=210409 RepID=A0A5B7CEE4_PORTR|nr:Insulin-like receptor [Portunus trituberculatus]